MFICPHDGADGADVSLVTGVFTISCRVTTTRGDVLVTEYKCDIRGCIQKFSD
jgi:hypothetical protein